MPPTAMRYLESVLNLVSSVLQVTYSDLLGIPIRAIHRISSARRFTLAAAFVAMGTSFAFAADQQPANEQGSRPPPRQVDQKIVEEGRAAAKADIAKKLVRYTIVAQPSVIDPDLKRLAASKYNILIVFQGCCPTTSIDYDRAYMEVALEHLKATYGFDPVAKLQKELWEERK